MASMPDSERIELGFLGFVGFGKKTQVDGNTGLLGFDADFRVHTFRRAARTSWMGQIIPASVYPGENGWL